MAIRNYYPNKINRLRNPSSSHSGWTKRRFVIGKYSYSIKNALLTTLALCAAFVAISYAVILYRNYFADPNVVMQREISSLTLKIGRFMELPKGEQPTLATVTDRDKLKGQDFFADAKNGDKLLIYPKAKRAILYRPSTEKVIEVTNLTSGSQNSGDLRQANP